MFLQDGSGTDLTDHFSIVYKYLMAVGTLELTSTAPGISKTHVMDFLNSCLKS